MNNQSNSPFTTTASNLFDSQPQQIKELLKGLHQQGNFTVLLASTQKASSTEQNMAQGPRIKEITSLMDSSSSGDNSSTGHSGDSLYGSKTSGGNMYGSQSYGDVVYGSKTYSQPGFHEFGGTSGDQGYKGSVVERGFVEPNSDYYDGDSFQEGNRMIAYPGYDYDNSMGASTGANDQGYNDPGQGYGGYTQGRGQGRFQGTRDGLMERVDWKMAQAAKQRSDGSAQGYDSSVRGRGCGMRGQGFGGRGQGRGRGTPGKGFDGGLMERVDWKKGNSTQQRSDASARGRGQGNANRGRESAKRGLPQGGRGNGPAAKKAKWQNEQQGGKHWGAEQGWFVRSKEQNSSPGTRGRGREQGGRGRGMRGRQGGQRNNTSGPKQGANGSAVQYGFDGKLVGPERFSETYGAYKHCKVCDVHINSMSCAKDHYSGKSHLKKLDAMLKKEELIKTTGIECDNCELCNVVYSSIDQATQHLNGARHKRAVEEAQAKAEGRTLPPDPRKLRKQQGGDRDNVAAVGTEKSSGETPSNEHMGPEDKEKITEPLKEFGGEMSHVDGKLHYKAKKSAEGTPHNNKQAHEHKKSQDGKVKRVPTDAEREVGSRHRKLFHCDICDISTSAPEHLSDHFAGKKHKATIESIKKRNSGCTTSGSDVFSCQLCNISTTDAYSLNLHLVGTRHVAKLEKIEKDKKKKAPEPLMDSATDPSSQQIFQPPEPLERPPLPPQRPPSPPPQRPPSPPASQQLFKSEENLEEEFAFEVSDMPQDELDIQQSLQDDTAYMPRLSF